MIEHVRVFEWSALPNRQAGQDVISKARCQEKAQTNKRLAQTQNLPSDSVALNW